jgi:hypothetical protein
MAMVIMLSGPYPESFPQPRRHAPPPVLVLFHCLFRMVSLLLARLPESPQSSESFFNGGIAHSPHIRDVPRQCPVLNRRVSCLRCLQWRIGLIVSLSVIPLPVVLFSLRGRFGSVEVNPTEKGNVSGCKTEKVEHFTHQRGQVPDTLTSHGSIHSGWN